MNKICPLPGWNLSDIPLTQNRQQYPQRKHSEHSEKGEFGAAGLLRRWHLRCVLKETHRPEIVLSMGVKGISNRGSSNVEREAWDGKLWGICGKQPVVWFGKT